MNKIPSITLGNVGRCIYCHTRDTKLSKEHVVPFGLNGPWLLLEASCKRCAGITSGFERAVLRRTFDKMRTALNFPSRRKQERPLKLPLDIEREGGKKETVYLPTEEYPAVVGMPYFGPPAYLTERTDKRLQVVGMIAVQIGGPPVEEVGRRFSAQGISGEAAFEPVGAFVRMLAKVAYGFAVAAIGCDLDKFEEVYVLPAILGESDDIAHWVGGSLSDPPDVPTDLHHVNLNLIKGEIRVSVRLFAQFGAPEYVVVVGRVSANSLSELGLPQGAYWSY